MANLNDVNEASTTNYAQHLEVESPASNVDVRFRAFSDNEGDEALWLSGNRSDQSLGIRQTLQNQAEFASQIGMNLLQLLTCNIIGYFSEHLSPRNIAFLLLSASVMMSSWLSLDPSAAGWAVGLVYVFASLRQTGAVEPLWCVAGALTAQAGFDTLPQAGQRIAWWILGVVAAACEVCWWPCADFLIENSFHNWLVHFSTFYAVVVEIWLWPHLLHLDPSSWHITQEVQKIHNAPQPTPGSIVEHGPAETWDTLAKMGMGLAIVMILPVLACVVMAGIIVWRQNPRLFMTMGVAYMTVVAVCVIFRNASMQQVVVIGEVAIGCIFIALVREQLYSEFEDMTTWRMQCIIVLVMVGLRHAAELYLPGTAGDKGEAAIILVFQLLCKQWLLAQCSAFHLKLPCWSSAVWAPRRSSALLGRDDVYAKSLVLSR